MKRWHVKYGNELWYDMTSYHSAAVFDRKAMYSKDFYDSLYQFFLEYQPDLSVVYDELATLISNSASDDEIIDLIRERYPEIYNYKGNTMELQKEVDRLKQELAEQKAEVEQLTRRFENLQGNVTQTSVGTAVSGDSVKLYADDGGAWQGYGTFETTTLPFIRTPRSYQASWVTRGATDEMEQQEIDRNTGSNNEPLPDSEMKGALPIFDMLDVEPNGSCRYHGYGCDCAKKLYGELKPETVLNEDGTTSKKWTFDNKKLFQGLAQELLKVFDLETRSESSEPKPSPEPTEVVYVLRIQPDSVLHAKMIEFAEEWSYADELIGIEKRYAFE